MKRRANKKMRIRKDFWITTLSAVAIGVMLFIGGNVGSSKPATKAKGKFQTQVVKKKGKYAAENSEKVQFFTVK